MGKFHKTKCLQFQLHLSFRGNTLYCVGQKCLLRWLYSRENFRSTLDNREKR